MITLKLVSVFILTYLTGRVSGNFFVCDNHDDCAAPEATCIDSFCKCPTGQTLTVDGTQCLDVVLSYGGSCTDDTQCAPLLGKYICKSQTCQCATGYRYLHGNCIKYSLLGESCQRNEDCFVSPDLFAMVCTDSKCTCNSGYYPRGEYDCRPLAKEYGDICALDTDCQNIPDTICNNGCVQKTEPETPNTKHFLKTDDDDHLQKSYSTFDADVICDTNQDCNEPNTYCSPITKRCVCKKGYFLHSTGCVGELGVDVKCQVNSDCKTTPRACQDGMCICPITHFYKPGLDGCVKAGYKNNDRIACVNDLGCAVMGTYASCVSEGLNSFCECNFGTELNEHSICIPSTGVQPDCVENEDCTIFNSICDKQNGKCICTDGYRLEEDTCSPNLGTECDDDKLSCLIEHSTCNVENEEDDIKLCSCDSDYVQIDDVTCLKSSSLNEECTNSLQCTRTNTECKQGKCACIQNSLEIGNLCVMAKKMGDYCTNLEQCQITIGEDVVCRNSKCQCPPGYKPTEDNKGCKSNSFSIHSKNNLFVLLILAVFYFRM